MAFASAQGSGGLSTERLENSEVSQAVHDDSLREILQSILAELVEIKELLASVAVSS